jgi:TIR domain
MKRSKPKPRKPGKQTGTRSVRKKGPVFTIFISHIHEEAAVARELRDWFHAAFPGLVKAFVSSDYEDNPLGTRWLQKINRAMTRSRLLVTLLSPQSWERMWIHLEAGWALGRGIDILPLCHSGMSIERLPRPYSDYGGTEVERDDFAQRLLVALKGHLRLAHSLPPGMLGGLSADVRNACAKLSSTIKVTSTRPASGLGAIDEANSTSDQQLAHLLPDRSWRLFFNPRAGAGKSKVMRFGADGSIIEGANHNEASWRTRGGQLELLDSNGRVHSRFNYDGSSRRFSHTNDPDTGSITKHGIRDQLLIDESERLPAHSSQVTEKIVDMNYPVSSGMQARLEADGYSLSWARRERVHGLVDTEGYEEVVEADRQGRAASFRTTDGMVLLKRQLTAKAS